MALSSIPVGITALTCTGSASSYHLARGVAASAQEVVEKAANINKTELPEDWKLVPQAHTTDSVKRQGGAYLAMNAQQEMTQTSKSQTYQGEHEKATPENACGAIILVFVGEDEGEEVVESGGGHSFALLLQGENMRVTTWRLWLLYFLVHFRSAGMVFALPKLLDENFPGRTERDIALDLLIGVLGLILGLVIACVAM